MPATLIFELKLESPPGVITPQAALWINPQKTSEIKAFKQIDLTREGDLFKGTFALADDDPENTPFMMKLTAWHNTSWALVVQSDKPAPHEVFRDNGKVTRVPYELAGVCTK